MLCLLLVECVLYYRVVYGDIADQCVANAQRFPIFIFIFICLLYIGYIIETRGSGETSVIV
jgi:hypothetical protein